MIQTAASRAIPLPTRQHAQTAAHVLARLIILTAVCLALLRTGKSPSGGQPSQKPVVEPTNNLDLQLARLYMTWTPDSQQALINLLTRRGEFEKSARLSLAGEPDPGTLPALLISAENQIHVLDWESAKQTLNRMLEIQPDHPTANLWMGLLTIPDEQAVDYIRAAASSNSTIQPLAASILGIIQVAGYEPRDVALRLVEAGEWAFAQRLLTLQIQQHNLDAFAFAYRGYALDRLGLDGIEDIQTAVALEPALPIGFYMLGMHYRQSDDFDLSLQSFLDAYLLEPDNPAYAAEVGMAYQLNDDFARAAEWYALSVSLAPGDGRFAALQAAFYAETQYDLAESGFEIVQNLAAAYPDDAAIQGSWGRVLFYMGDFDTATTVLERALSIAPNDLRIRFYYGETLERGGNRGAALEQYAIVAQRENRFQEAAQRGILRLSQ